MPRTKGSKNKSPRMSLDEKINATCIEIESLQQQLKDKKKQLKDLKKQKEDDNIKKILEAAQSSGKSVDEIVSFLSQE